MLVIIAQRKEHAKHFAYQNSIHKDDWKYVDDPRRLMGLPGNPEVIFCRLPDWFMGKSAEATIMFNNIIDEHHKRLGRKP